MTLQLKKSGSYTYLYAIKSFRKEDGRCTTKVVEKFGTVEELREKLGGEDPIEWARARVAEMTASEKEENQKVVVEYDPQTYIQKGEQRSYNGGYLFLQKIYYELGLDYICKKIAKKHKLLKYDLNGILSMLVYTRILYPGSKRSSLEDAGKFFEQPECTLEQVYRALSLLAEEFNEIQADVYKRSRKIWKRNTQVVYYDLTNYFFECEEEGGLVQFGHCKEGRPLSVVQMGLFMDHDGFPLAMCIEPGNKAETSTLKPMEQILKDKFGLSKLVVCTARTTASVTGHSLPCGPSRSSRDIFRNGHWTARGGARPALTRNTTSVPWTPKSIARPFSIRNVGTPPGCPPERRWSSASSSRSHSSTRRISLMCANGR